MDPILWRAPGRHHQATVRLSGAIRRSAGKVQGLGFQPQLPPRRKPGMLGCSLCFFSGNIMAWLWGFQQQKMCLVLFFFKGVCVCVMTQWGLIGFYDDDDDGDDDVLIYTYVILWLLLLLLLYTLWFYILLELIGIKFKKNITKKLVRVIGMTLRKNLLQLRNLDKQCPTKHGDFP